MALAGAERIFELMDQEPEVDDGKVTLVNANIDENGNITESKERTNKWAWKVPNDDGTCKYVELKGYVILENVSFAYDKEVPNSKKAILNYRLIGHSENYYLLEVDLKTGRHHQIRCQLAKMGCPIKGDLKYGAPRSNPDGSICLHARKVRFIHPVSKELIELEAPLPEGNLWKGFELL